MARIVPVILAGGSGTRLWPLSREDRPKQFLSLDMGASLLQQTIRRALSEADAGAVFTVADERHVFLLQEELDAIDPALLPGILLEPVGRNTAPALAYAAVVIRETIPDAILWVMPADHAIEDVPALRTALRRALPAAESGHIVTFGIKPDRPETGFGYIKRSHPLPGCDGVFGVAHFVEKPPQDVAEAMVASQDYVWNSGMLLTGAATFLDALQTHAPAIADAIGRAVAARRADGPGGPVRVPATLYAEIPPEPFDKAVLERSPRVAVVPCDIGWSDVGTWNNMWQLLPHDGDGNVVHGAVIIDQSSNCLVRSTGRLVACTGVRDLAIIETPDAVLVADRQEAAGMRRLMQALKAQSRPEIGNGADAASWGQSRTLYETTGCRIREIIVQPGGKLSPRLYRSRAIHWMVTAGTATVTVGDAVRELAAHHRIDIAPRTKHRFENRGAEPFHLIETQYGADLDESDVVLVEDQYAERDVS